MMGSAAASTVDPTLVARFSEALARLNPAAGRIGLAVSGGPDSMAMLLLAHAAIPGGFEVATVDHGLRPEAREECALVEAACAERGVPCGVLRVTVGKGNVQAKAREARYEALGDWAERRALSAIATAHHADDQAETLLMRLNRGSGVAGLAGVREAIWADHFALSVIRPLLDFRRAELESVIAPAGISVAFDPSNENVQFDRVRIRKALAQADWLDPLAISRSAQHLAEADEALDFVTDQLWEAHSRDGNDLYVRPHPSRVIRLRLLAKGLAALDSSARGSEIAALDARLARERRGNLAGVLVEWVEREEGAYLRFRPEPPRRTG